METLVFVGISMAFAGFFWWVGQRPTVTPEEQDRLIRLGHK